MNETGHFFNEGFGWECVRCREASGSEAARVDEESEEEKASALPRFFREGEAEGGGPRLSARALARWADEARTRLRCPGCGAEEELEG